MKKIYLLFFGLFLPSFILAQATNNEEVNPTTQKPLSNDVYLPFGPTNIVTNVGGETTVIGAMPKTDCVPVVNDIVVPDEEKEKVFYTTTTQSILGQSENIVTFMVKHNAKNRINIDVKVENIENGTSYSKSIVYGDGFVTTPRTYNWATYSKNDSFLSLFKKAVNGDKYEKEMSKATVSVAPIDFNKDGIDDFIFCINDDIIQIDGKTLSIVTQCRDINGSTNYDYYCQSVCVGDFTGDGIKDVLVLCSACKDNPNPLEHYKAYLSTTLTLLPGGNLYVDYTKLIPKKQIKVFKLSDRELCRDLGENESIVGCPTNEIVAFNVNTSLGVPQIAIAQSVPTNYGNVLHQLTVYEIVASKMTIADTEFADCFNFIDTRHFEEKMTNPYQSSKTEHRPWFYRPPLCNIMYKGNMSPSALFWADKIFIENNRKLQQVGDVLFNKKLYLSETQMTECCFGDNLYERVIAVTSGAYANADEKATLNDAQRLIIQTICSKNADGVCEDACTKFYNVSIEDGKYTIGEVSQIDLSGKYRNMLKHTVSMIAYRKTPGVNLKFKSWKYKETVPNVIALVILPPYSASESVEGKTSVSYTKKESASHTNSSTSNKTWSLGFKVTTPAIIAPWFKLSVGVTYAGSSNTTTAHAVTSDISLTHTCPTHMVEYTYIPCDVYTYEVQEAEYLPQEMVGTTMEFSIAREAAINAATNLEDYNAIAQENGIPSIEISSIAGDLDSYFKSSAYSDQTVYENHFNHVPGTLTVGIPFTVKRNNVTTSTSISMGETVSNGEGGSWSVTGSVDLNFGTLTSPRVNITGSYGQGESWSTTSTFGNAVALSGTVGPLKENSNIISYSARQLMYKQVRYFKKDGDKFVQINDANKADYKQEYYVSDWTVTDCNIEDYTTEIMQCPYAIPTISVRNGLLHVYCHEPNLVEITNSNGIVVSRTQVQGEQLFILGKGIYVVKIGNNTKKIVL